MTLQRRYECRVHGRSSSDDVCCEQAKLFPDPETPVTRILDRARATHLEREAQYGGDGYLQLGNVMRALFPTGITLATEEEHARYYLMEKMVEKLCRYATNYASGGHPDSIHDLGVYAFKMEAHDERQCRPDHRR